MLPQCTQGQQPPHTPPEEIWPDIMFLASPHFSLVIGQPFRKLRQRHGLPRERVRAVPAEMENARPQNVVADEGKRVAVRIPHPFARPVSRRIEDPPHTGLLEAGGECRLLQISVEWP